MASSLFTSLFRRPPPPPTLAPKFPYTLKNNPYRAKRLWPPDFTKLSQKHQFRLERRYRRRTKLKFARPNWMKGVQLAQWGSILFVLIYGVFYLEVEGSGRTVFDGIRERVGMEVKEFGGVGSGRREEGSPVAEEG